MVVEHADVPGLPGEEEAVSDTGVAGVLVGVGATGVYVLRCWLYPFARCPWCKGSGKRFSPNGKAFGRCRHCKGSGKRVRWGRRLFGP